MIRFFVHHKTAANLILIMVIGLGIYSCKDMVRETFPKFSLDRVIVRVDYIGASAEELETSVCVLLEEALDGIDGIEQFVARAREGSCNVTVEMKHGYNLDLLYRDVRNEIEQINNLPDQAEDPIVYVQKTNMPVISIALAGDTNFRDLKEYANIIKDDLIENSVATLVKLQGVSDIEIKIKVDEQTLRGLGLDLFRLRDIILSQSGDSPVGSVKSNDQELIIRVTDQRRTPDEFTDLLVVSDNKGSRVFLSDIAEISWAKENEEDVCYLNGKRAVILAIKKSEGEDALRIRKNVIDFVENFQSRLSSGMEMKLIEDSAKVIDDRLSMLMKNVIQGFILVFFSLWIFLDVRLAFWTALGIPFAFLGAIFFMQFTGLTMNMITMFSLILGLGLIVDDAIVIGENIFTHLKSGKEPFAACIAGVKQVSGGVISSFLTTVAVFMPLVFLKGQIGKVLYVLPIGVILCLSVSLVEAFFVLPNHLVHSLKNIGTNIKTNIVRSKIEESIEYFIDNIFSPFVAFCLKYRYVTLSIMIGLLIISIGLVKGGRLSFVAFPELDGDVLVCYILMPSGTPIGMTKSVAGRIEDGIWDVDRELSPSQPEEQPLIRNVKTLYGVNPDANDVGPHVATISVELLSSEIRAHKSNLVLEKWRERVGTIEDTLSLKYKSLIIGPAGMAFEIRLKGGSLKMLGAAAKELEDKLDEYNGVYNINNNLNAGKLEARVVTKPIAKTLGFTSRDIVQQLNSSFFGGKVQEFQSGKENVEVKVKFADRDRNSLSDLENFYLVDKRGNQVPLLNIAEINMERGYSNIYHINGRRTVTVSADIDTLHGNSSKIMKELVKDYFPKLKGRYPGLRMEVAGQEMETSKTLGSVNSGMVIGLSAIFIVLSFVFGSYIQPLTIMTVIPFGLIGTIFGFYFMGIDLSMPSILGFASLSGIVVNDSIVLVDFINKNINLGKNPLTAGKEASIARFRAVFLTSITTVMGLLPILLEKSVQAQVLVPMAAAIVFGLIFSTVNVLIFVPCLNGIFYDIGILKQRKD